MCSFSPAPVTAESRHQVESAASALGATLEVRWSTFDEYLDALERAHPSINVVHFVGHGPIRYAGMGGENRAPTAAELDRMKVAVGGGDAGRRIRTVVRAGLCSERICRDRGIDHALPLDRGPRRAVFHAHAGRGPHAPGFGIRSGADRRARRRPLADRAPQVGRARELAAVRSGAGAHRRCAGPRARCHRRCLSLCCQQHLHECAPAAMGARRRHLQVPRAHCKSGHPGTYHRGSFPARGALADRAGHHRMGRDHDRNLPEPVG